MPISQASSRRDWYALRKKLAARASPARWTVTGEAVWETPAGFGSIAYTRGIILVMMYGDRWIAHHGSTDHPVLGESGPVVVALICCPRVRMTRLRHETIRRDYHL